MCGIFGFFSQEGRDQSYCSKVAANLLTELRHRGPDGNGVLYYSHDLRHSREPFSTNSAFLGHTRLAIIDMSPAGLQPRMSRDGKYAITFNGEIYNYIELRTELETLGCVFESNSDTEVLLQAYVQWGRDCLLKLNGMFSFAVMDLNKRVLFCARDFFGIKPFYYSTANNAFQFASELPALLSFPDVDRQLSPQGVFNFLQYGSIEPHDSTLFPYIKILPPAHCLEISLDTCEIPRPESYWAIDLAQRSALSYEDAADKLKHLFLDSIRLHLRSDAPLGVALSGGIDSSAVACCVRHLQPDRELHSFSYLPDDPTISEEEWIRIANKTANTLNHAARATVDDLINDLPVLIKRLGEPFGGTSIYAQFSMFKEAQRNGVTVVLEGQGADELLAGYDGFCMQRAVTLARQGNFQQAGLFLQKASKWPARSFSRLMNRTLTEYFNLGKNRQPSCDLFNTARLADHGIETATPCQGLHDHPDLVRSTLANFISWENLPNLLRHGDRNSMTFSIENRVPFLTRELAEFLLSLPEEYLIDAEGCSKSIFRTAMRGIVPDAILDRRDKIGFATPENTWLGRMHGTIKELVNESDLGMIDKRAALDLIDGNLKNVTGPALWRLVNYLYWLKEFNLKPC